MRHIVLNDGSGDAFVLRVDDVTFARAINPGDVPQLFNFMPDAASVVFVKSERVGGQDVVFAVKQTIDEVIRALDADTLVAR